MGKPGLRTWRIRIRCKLTGEQRARRYIVTVSAHTPFEAIQSLIYAGQHKLVNGTTSIEVLDT